nr:MAG TPA: hypothetical protein [Caudoviricetes sp.]
MSRPSQPRLLQTKCGWCASFRLHGQSMLQAKPFLPFHSVNFVDCGREVCYTAFAGLSP